MTTGKSNRAFEKNLGAFWYTANELHKSIVLLSASVVAGSSPSEKIKQVYDTIHERLSYLSQGLSFAKRHDQDTIEMKYKTAEGLMTILPEKWEQAETALALALTVAPESRLEENYSIAKAQMESLMQQWEKLKTS